MAHLNHLFCTFALLGALLNTVVAPAAADCTDIKCLARVAREHMVAAGGRA
jgi:hypothetical protein